MCVIIGVQFLTTNYGERGGVREREGGEGNRERRKGRWRRRGVEGGKGGGGGGEWKEEREEEEGSGRRKSFIGPHKYLYIIA